MRKTYVGCILCLSAQVWAQDTAYWFAAPHLSEQLDAGIPLNRPAFLSVANATGQTAHVTITLYNGGTNPNVTNV
ncbi:MAG: hypothetical protein LBQ68_08570, partial [Clostridiales bacterium]|nr:hypothetical protein [Clostridiales bacterium]